MIPRIRYWSTCTLIAVQNAALWAILAVAITPRIANAATFYVSQNGSNNYTCLQAQALTTAKLTIAAGISCLVVGDTLLINSGTYTEAIDSNDLQIPSGTSWDNVVTIAAVPGKTVTLKPNAGTEVINLADAKLHYLVIDGLILDASNGTNNGFSLSNGANHIRLQNSEIKSAYSNGVLLTDRAEYNEFVNVAVHDTGRSGKGHGMYIATSFNTIERCRIFNSQRYGIHIYDSFGQVNENVVRSNTVWNNSLGQCCDAGILVGSGNGNIAYNNVVYRNSYGIIAGFQNATNTKIFNNTVYENVNYGIQIRDSSTKAIVKNNIVYKSLTSIDNQGHGTILAHNLTADPKVVHAATLDFTPQPGSPAIDAGAPADEVQVDFRGIKRPQGQGYDIGAYEYVEPLNRSIAPPNNLQVVPRE